MLTAVVYFDEVFLVNAAVDLLLLKTAAALTGGGERPWRLWTGAAFGGLAAAAVYLPGLGWLGRLPGSALSYAGLCLLCFGWRSRAWKRWLWFFCVCCGFAGLALALCGLLRSLNESTGCAILLVTHDPVTAAAASRVHLLKDGAFVGAFDTGHDPALVSERYHAAAGGKSEGAAR